MTNELEWLDLKGEETGVLLYRLLPAVVILGDINSPALWLDCDGAAHLHIQRKPSGGHKHLKEGGFGENEWPSAVSLCCARWEINSSTKLGPLKSTYRIF